MDKQLEKALQEYNERQNVSAHEIADKYGVDVQALHDAYARLRSWGKKGT